MASSIRKVIMLFALSGYFFCKPEQLLPDLFAQAQTNYQEGNYKKAQELLLQLEEQKSPFVLYNLGNCYFYLGDNFKALVCWKKAQYLGDAALFMQAQQLIDSLKIEKRSLWQNIQCFIIWIGKFLPLFVWQLGFLVFCCMLFFSIVCVTGFMRKWLIGISLLLMLIWGLIFWISYSFNISSRGVLVSDASLRIGPASEFPHQGGINKNIEVSILQHSNGWYKIRHCQQQGWIPCESIEPIFIHD